MTQAGHQDPNSECCRWTSVADLLTGKADAPIALLGAPLNEKSLTPGRCDLAPGAVRAAMKRFSLFDVETGGSLDGLAIHDAGDLFLKIRTPAEAHEPIIEKMTTLASAHDLTILLGGNNAVTRSGLHGLGALDRVGLITLDAHFDLRDTDCGMVNGNPVRALLEDGLPGKNIVQVGLAPFANTKRMSEVAAREGVTVVPMGTIRERCVLSVLEEAVTKLSGQCDVLYVDFDIDVIDRSQCPGAPGARPGGMAVTDFFAAARFLAAQPKVKAVDLTEYDPSLDVADITQLTAGRWVCEILAGYQARKAVAT